MTITVGSQADIFRRLKQNLVNWFGQDTPNLDGLLQGIANSQSYIYNLQTYANLQTRIRTATGIYLDLAAQDFLGDTLPRYAGENDASYRNRILANILQVKCTRPALYNAILQLTGIPPVMFEPWRPIDCGCYGGESSTNYTMGYGTAGLYGSGSYPWQGFILVFTPPYQGMSTYAGYGGLSGLDAMPMGYNAAGGDAQGWYGGAILVDIIVSDQSVYELINSSKVFGTTIWVRIEHGPQT